MKESISYANKLIQRFNEKVGFLPIFLKDSLTKVHKNKNGFMLPLRMYKKYQIKWLLILSVIIILCTLLLVQVDMSKAKWWHFLDHSLKVFVSIACCWMVAGYFLTNSFARLPNFSKNMISILASIVILFILGFVIDIIAPKNYLFNSEIGYQTPQEILIHFVANTFLSLLCYFVFSNRYTSTALKIKRMEKDLIEQAHLRAQLISLQQQISPHFLFNSLSTLKTLVSDPLARDYIVHLASVYRYVLSFNDQYLTKLDDELKFISSYIYILNERFGDMLQVNIHIPQQDRFLYLPSLSLQLLIENAIKHNVCSQERPLHISITTTNAQELRVENNFQPKQSRMERPGMGLKNIIERYKLLVDRSVDVTHNAEKFTVTIPLLKK
ncbi:histidine kinase [Flavobacterium psychroterrae]|uniref:Histidine kinase n=1 Tax=Flavobacterium psychroterrae TaxID=2133767 RepID=A0ABS5PIF6_9FLAO|nr:histidine kinase [Flavobacterium psychroterrae]MBS7234093.1 histidine kinase [Flavobacterium psychroterrae]